MTGKPDLTAVDHIAVPSALQTYCGRTEAEAPRAWDLCSLPAGADDPAFDPVAAGWCAECFAELRRAPGQGSPGERP